VATIEGSAAPDLVGHRFPACRVAVEEACDGELRAVLGAPERRADEPAHPLMAFLVAQRGLGPLDALFALFGAHADDGPMLGEWSVDQTAPLRVGRTYTVRGAVERVERKSGARTGVFDVRAVTARFRAPVLGGDRVVAGGRVVAVRADGALECEIWLDAHRPGAGAPVRALSGTATIDPRAREEAAWPATT
jgi:acyl dehydratase